MDAVCDDGNKIRPEASAYQANVHHALPIFFL